MMVGILSNDLRPIVIASVNHSMACYRYIFFSVYLLEVLIIDQLVEHVLESFVLRGNLPAELLVFGYALSTQCVF